VREVPERPEHPRFSIEVVDSGDRTTVAVSGELDIAVSGRFCDAVRAALAAGPVLVDLREVTFMDSTGVRALNTLLRECSENGWGMHVSSDMTDAVRQVLEMTAMMPLLPLEDPA
jgi:anti-anti-sigma factor